MGNRKRNAYWIKDYDLVELGRIKSDSYLGAPTLQQNAQDGWEELPLLEL